MNRKLINVKAVSELLNIKPSTVYQWAELQQIPCVKLNGSLRFDPSDIEKWVESCKIRAMADYNQIQTVTGSPRKEVKV